MQRLTLIIAVAAIGLLCACQDGESPSPNANAAFIARSIAAADLFQARLQSKLGEAMANGGPVAAIEVCAVSAPAIATEVSAETGAVVRRVSLRPRNPGAATKGALTSRLEALSKRPLDADGAPTLMSWTEGEGRTATFNTLLSVVMRDQPCAACHGTKIADDVRAAIAERYPQDGATGFSAGDLRGAILVSWSQHDRDQFGEDK